MNKFWVLEAPDGADAARRRAKWNENDDIRYELVECPVNPLGHRRAGGRLTPVNVLIPNIEPYDFVWESWYCLVQKRVLEFFDQAGFQGYAVAPAIVKFARTSRRAPDFWELVAKGSAGMASPESGSKVLSVCPGCGLDRYSRITAPSMLIDQSQWDGSDFFHVQPVSASIFVTDRVVQALGQSQFKGWGAYSLEEMKEKFDISVPGEPSETKQTG
jgi:hypothetical protein